MKNIFKSLVLNFNGTLQKSLLTSLLSGVLLFFSFALMTSALLGCGRNVAASKAPANRQEQAELDMEAGRYEAAQVKLEQLLKVEPANHKATSLLAASVAAQGGVTMFALLQKAAESQTSTPGSSGAGTATSASGNSLNKMLAILPYLTAITLEKMEIACATMESIPVGVRTTEMILQTSVFYSTLALLKLKQLKENPDLLAALTPEQVASILGNLVSAVPASSNPNDPVSKGAKAVQSSITNAAGASDFEKLKTVLSASTSP